MQRIAIVDSHTGGEPTRVVVQGGPDLGGGSVARQLGVFRRRFDHYRSAIVNEPRGSDVMVGALLVPPSRPECSAGVIFFNNVGFLGMCGHGTIGLMVTLAHLGLIKPGVHAIETCLGVVSAELLPRGEVTINNVPSYRKAAGVKLRVLGFRRVQGDVAWGGNWFFLVEDHGEELSAENAPRLTEVAWQIRQAINAQGFPEVDHVELFGPPSRRAFDSRNFVLCPGKAYDRSPCGTGTSAKLACLAARGKLQEGEEWIQESIIGSTFRGSFRWIDRERGLVQPTITGSAWIDSEATLLLDESDPYCWGIGARRRRRAK